MAKTTTQWLPTLAMAVAIAGALGGPAVTYGIMQNKITNVELRIDAMATGSALAVVRRDVAELDADLDKAKGILHTRISRVQQEVSGLKTSALERVTDVEVKITKLDLKIDGYSRETQSAASAAQATMASILQRLQGDIR